jgi:predicted nuclease of predicted toxin-antitoxin system
MKARFQADADLNEDIVMALIRREPSVDFRTAEEAGLRGLPDGAVLALASEDNRILVSHDRKTMSRHFAQFTISRGSPGVFIISQNVSVRAASDELPLVWAASEAEEWRNLIVELPL